MSEMIKAGFFYLREMKNYRQASILHGKNIYILDLKAKH